VTSFEKSEQRFNLPDPDKIFTSHEPALRLLIASLSKGLRFGVGVLFACSSIVRVLRDRLWGRAGAESLPVVDLLLLLCGSTDTGQPTALLKMNAHPAASQANPHRSFALGKPAINARRRKALAKAICVRLYGSAPVDLQKAKRRGWFGMLLSVVGCCRARFYSP
jgi:hypothetical protein